MSNPLPTRTEAQFSRSVAIYLIQHRTTRGSNSWRSTSARPCSTAEPDFKKFGVSIQPVPAAIPVATVRICPPLPLEAHVRTGGKSFPSSRQFGEVANVCSATLSCPRVNLFVFNE